MSEITDFDTLRRAMAENGEQPEGPARNARAEQLLVAAEKLNVPLAVIEALGHQLKVYNYSSEKDKMFVPFARLLRMWDERPEDFDEYETHTLHWVFKWMSSGMLDQPHVPLASIEKWLGEMEHRYRLAGHSERAVRSAEFNVAAHIGDLPRAERAYAAWLVADRDRMADCHACELHGQGWWQSERSRDAEALELWAPVLEGELSCAHEPHTSLAASLLPLLRLGRLDEARANHLRGFRLVRAMESMRGAYADHVEFCALSGNEARGLELLAERPAYFTDTGHPRSGLEFLSVVALLMDRLTGLGLGDRQVPGPAGRSWTARELATHARAEALDLAGRFDARNGTAHVSERARARMAQEPLVERLPLGVRSVRTAAPVVASPVVAPEAAEPDLAALIAEARRLSDGLLPNAVEAWVAVSRAAQDVELDPRDRAEIADHQAMDLGPEGIELFERAAELYTEAGDPGEALAARARGAFVRTLAGDMAAALTAIAGPYDEILALYADDGTGVRQTASVLMARARILMRRVQEAGEAPEENGDGIPGEQAGADGVSPLGEDPAGDGAPTSAETPVDGPVTDGLPSSGALGGAARQGEMPGGGSADGGVSGDDSTAAGAPDGAATAAGGSDGKPTTAEDPNSAPATATAPEDNPTPTAAPGGNPTAAGVSGGNPTAAGVPGRRPSMASLQADADAAVREVLALVDGRAGDDVQLGSRAAEAWAMFAELAVGAGELRTGADLFRHAAEGFVGAGLPWFAVESEARLAQLAHHMGDVAEAERALRAALEHGGPYLEAVGRAQLHLQLAEVLGGRGLVEEAAEHALEAAHWADGAGEGPALGAWARQLLGGFLLRQGRWAEAAEVLESALPDLAAETHGDGAVVQVQWWLGDCLSELGEHRAAAERRLQAAEIARLWPEQHDHATLAHLAGESLGQAGLSAEADQAYTRAGELWRSLGDVHGLVRALRARAWLALGTEDGQGDARELMAAAVRECEEALGADAADEEARQRLVAELGRTHRQFGDLLARSAAEDDDDDSIRAALEDALSQVTEAIVVFASLGDDALHSRTGAELAAGWLEADLSRPDRAAARARAVLAAYQAYEAQEVYDGSDADETAPARRAEAQQMLDVLED
ncbi:tetratricopeptide repeat protein [Streptomyces sp. NBC_00140]|uniref:tetratricopeptide repeat protein n=1 Tax=Streptomyces sp. NBC_00140 TaxID=2975664 RepID=UPI002256496D|nr:tetratricopeptide repeat protein [Streptomyces sp. NBC_00140]MCX5331097.1 tetratricopeptide repeat protein [Streptomyces sp. NBC_00140]